ncbi:hypothetical protein HPB49_004003 [Dermacentor silvarum]|uniref:Uncharacterized protein n=1 Tax=Dermacentor silvarum TaxID=543639 RepID=A0ACB8CV41_DERSI|nr:hypothetical protein HPB49_004003 [Dermacentor silvarum]
MAVALQSRLGHEMYGLNEHKVCSLKKMGPVSGTSGSQANALHISETWKSRMGECPILAVVPHPYTRPDGVALPSSVRSAVDDAFSASFHCAVECQKLITDILFDTNCKVTNNHQTQILGHLRQLVQEYDGMRAVAARQCGRAQELCDQLTRTRTASAMLCPGAFPPAVPLVSYAAVVRGGATAGVTAAASGGGAVDVGARREHITFLTPLVPTATAAQDLSTVVKTNVYLVRERIGEISIRKTPHGLTILSDDKDSMDRLKIAIEDDVVTKTSMSVHFAQKRKAHVKLTGVDPDFPAVNVLAHINARNPDLTLDSSECSVRTTIKERSGNHTHVLEVDPATFRSLMLRGRVSVGWTSAALVEDIHVPTCTYCATYGHPRRACPVRQEPERAVCTRCAGNHLVAQCAVRQGDAAVCCNECRKAGLAESHPTGDRSCPRLASRIARLRAHLTFNPQPTCLLLLELFLADLNTPVLSFLFHATLFIYISVPFCRLARTGHVCYHLFWFDTGDSSSDMEEAFKECVVSPVVSISSPAFSLSWRSISSWLVRLILSSSRRTWIILATLDWSIT